MEPTVEYVNVEKGYVVMSNKAVLDISNYFDSEGDDTDQLLDVSVVVAGPDPEGYWWTLMLDEMPPFMRRAC